ncbi:unnamed protein product [Tetraodon nigroviridis]|uniref:(spotted green pufferfish) hypothetical protein n=1 Tax=Tetraodon nigroviridis TaxID=99883 RepID=Q4RPJ3_TETNG|nr:unnamed protein product [Tetraodon nigroviridis]
MTTNAKICFSVRLNWGKVVWNGGDENSRGSASPPSNSRPIMLSALAQRTANLRSPSSSGSQLIHPSAFKPTETGFRGDPQGDLSRRIYVLYQDKCTKRSFFPLSKSVKQKSWSSRQKKERSHIERGEQEGRVMSSTDCYQPQQWPSPWHLLNNYILSPELKGNASTCRVTPSVCTSWFNN